MRNNVPRGVTLPTNRIDVSIENWLRNEVGRAYDAHKADPARAVTLKEAMSNVQKLIASNCQA